MDALIRAAAPDDVDDLLAVQREASIVAFAHIFRPGDVGGAGFPDETIRRSWVDVLENSQAEVLVAAVDGVVVGLVSYYPGRGLVERLFVLPEYSGRGIGGHLLEHAVSRLAAASGNDLWLWVLEQNHDARMFYERRGWRYSGETRRTQFPPHPLSLRYVLERSR